MWLPLLAPTKAKVEKGAMNWDTSAEDFSLDSQEGHMLKTALSMLRVLGRSQ